MSIPPADRTVRQRTLPQIGDSGQRLLAGATVGVVGAGGLGSPVIQYLAAAGLGTVHVFDDDTVELSNLNRQTLHGVDTIGQPKVDGALTAAARLSPETRLIPHRVRLTDANATEHLTGMDLILDGSDSFTTRFIIHRAATALGLPVVYGALMQWNAQVTVFWSDPPPETDWPATVLTDLFEDNAATHAAPGCAEAGVLGAVVGITGSFMALEAIKLILGTGRPLLGRLLLIDGLAGTTTQIPLAPTQPTSQPTVSTSEEPTGTTTTSPHPAPPTPTAVPVTDAIPAAVPVTDPDVGDGVGRELVWIDVRRPEESAEHPGPAGTVHWPLDALLRLSTGPATALPDGHPLALAQATAAPLLTFCASGPRSATAARHLTGLGWPVAGYLDGGLPSGDLSTPAQQTTADEEAHRG